MSQIESSINPTGLLVRDVAGVYRPAEPEEVLSAAQRMLFARVRHAEVMSSPAVMRDFLRMRLRHSHGPCAG
ncbi:MAG: hypothetical protein E6Q94_06240 [Burkholderiaceae bacterium]|jgi:DNA repair protein RadC|nr:MAG: hypothetical protein E6Q94_06240 [Burkholderiaceae bacterium]